MTKGIVRRIDELGRVVIPKEMRRTMQIKEGEQLEIVPNSNGDIILRKYSLFGVKKPILDGCNRTLKRLLSMEVVIFDKNQVISHVGGAKNYEEEQISNALLTALEGRKAINLSKRVSIIRTDSRDYAHQYIAPIIIDSELYGGILIIGEIYDNHKIVVESIVECLQELLG